MINVGDEQPVPANTPPPGRRRQQIEQLRAEEVKMYKDCMGNAYLKGGLPFAIFCQLLSSRKTEAEIVPKNYLKRGIVFLGNVFIGSLMFAPICYWKMVAMHNAENMRQKEMQLQNTFPGTEEAQTGTHQPDEFSYPVDTVTNLNELDTHFSSDFSTSGPTTDDDKDLKAPPTTYDELRARHRSHYSNTTPAPSSTLSFESGPSTLSSSFDKPASLEQPSRDQPPRKVVRNKYGDEIE